MNEYVRWVVVTDGEQNELRNMGLIFPDKRKGEWFENDIFKITKKGDEEILKGSFNNVNYEIDRNRGLIKAVDIIDYGYQWSRDNFPDRDFDSEVYQGINNLTVDDHINVLKIVSHYTTHNSSKTVNLPANYSYNDFKNLYMNAWKSGIKGLTTYREGTMTAVLEKKRELEEYKEDFEEIFRRANGNIIEDNVDLPKEYYSKGYVVNSNDDGTGKKWYVHLCYSDRTLKRPFAIFVNTNCRESAEITNETINSMEELAREEGIRGDLIKMQSEKQQGQTNVTKIARSIGFLLRHNVKIYKIVEVLDNGNYPLGSFSFRVKGLLKNYIKEGQKATGKTCPECNSNNIVYIEGCISCADCGWSKCG